MAAKSKESVYISVESLGVGQAAQDIKAVVGPISDLSKNLAKLLKEQNRTTTNVQNTVQNISKSKTEVTNITQVFATLSKEAGQASPAIGKALKFLSPTTLAIGGLTAALVGTANALKEDAEAFEKLHPEVVTAAGDMKAFKKESEATNLALDSLTGASVKPFFDEITKGAGEITTELKKFALLLTEGDIAKAFQKLATDWSAFSATVLGTVAEMGGSFERFFGKKNGYFEQMATKMADGKYQAQQMSKSLFDSSESGKKLTKETELAKKYLEDQEKAAKKTKDHFKEQKDILKEIKSMDSNLVVKMDGDNISYWNSKLLADFDKAEELFKEQLAELDKIEFEDLEAKELARQQLIEAHEKQIKDIRMRNAQEVGDNEFLIQQKLADAKNELDQQRSAELAASTSDYQKYLDTIKQLDESYAAQKKALEQMAQEASATNDIIQLEWINEQRLSKEQEYLQRKQQMQLEYAQSTNDQETLMRAQFLQAQEEKERAFLQAQEDYWNNLKQNSIDTISSGLGDLFADAIEGTGDMREAAYGMFKSLARNIFTSSMSQVVNNVIAAATGAMSSQSAIPIVGPALAAAAGAAMLALLPVMKAKLNNGTNSIQYATGGYISQGMVKGAYGTHDSVEALLQPGERVLSKAETKAYDEARFNSGNTININVAIQGGFDKTTITTEVRQYLIPEIKRALGQGYNLNPA